MPPEGGGHGHGSPIRGVDGRVPRTGSVRTASDPEGSSAKNSLSGAAVPPDPSRRRWHHPGSSVRRRSAWPGISSFREAGVSRGGGRPPGCCDNHVVTALYRTYRPLDFTQVVGQEAVVRTLRNAIESGQVRQAYLFAGPRGTGKTSMARILAKALTAEGGPSPDFDPTARIARTIADGTALDVVEMDA